MQFPNFSLENFRHNFLLHICLAKCHTHGWIKKIHQNCWFFFISLLQFPFKSLIFNLFMQLDEWWEQPASTVVDWVTVDGQNVAAWHNHVKQLLAFYDRGASWVTWMSTLKAWTFWGFPFVYTLPTLLSPLKTSYPPASASHAVTGNTFSGKLTLRWKWDCSMFLDWQETTGTRTSSLLPLPTLYPEVWFWLVLEFRWWFWLFFSLNVINS